MNDIFLSYDRNDRVRAQRFADTLESLGWSVWWDREIPLGESFDQVIEQELNAARCIVVLWSRDSVQSRWVKAEASAAFDRGRLVPVFIDRVTSPLEFRFIQAAELFDWNGDTADPEFGRVLQAVREMLGQTEQKQKPSGTIAPIRTKPALSTKSRSVALGMGIAIIALLVLGRNIFEKSPTPTVDSDFATTSSASATLPSTSTIDAKSVPPKDAFQIRVGEKIDQDIPAAGAGNIGQPYEQDHYVFTAKPGQRVYFRMAGHSTGLSYINWGLTDENGMEVFKACLGCGEPGVQTLTKGGTYTLTVGGEGDASTGTYRLQLFDVPPPSQFSFRIGDVIDENKPAAGAGIIESPGTEDVYRFTAVPRQSVYFRMLERSTGMDYMNWRLTDDNGMEMFNLCLGCGEPGVVTLIKGGEYVFTVGHKTNPSTGLYRLQLFDVPAPHQFNVKLGDRIRPGVPGAGAGVIESPGAEDVYVFSASPGQKAYFRVLEHSKGTDYLYCRLEDDNGMKLFELCLGCGEPGPQTLIKGGKYTLTVGNRTNPSTGNYAIEIGAR